MRRCEVEARRVGASGRRETVKEVEVETRRRRRRAFFLFSKQRPPIARLSHLALLAGHPLLGRRRLWLDHGRQPRDRARQVQGGKARPVASELLHPFLLIGRQFLIARHQLVPRHGDGNGGDGGGPPQGAGHD